MVNPENALKAVVTCVWPARAVLGEGPLFDAAEGAVWWLDIKRRRLYRYLLANRGRDHWELPLRVGSIASPPREWQTPDGFARVFLCGCDEGFAWLGVGTQARADCTKVLPIVDPEAGLPGNRFNDGKMGPDGRFYAGTMDDAERDARGALYVLNRRGEAKCLDRNYMVTNGPAFSPDGRTVYHNDSARQTVYAFDLSADGELENRRILVRFGAGDGFPDGMTVDQGGNLWIAMWDGARVQRVTPDGVLAGWVDCPAAKMTSCVFVSDRVLFATSASIGAAPDDRLAGGLFRIELTSGRA